MTATMTALPAGTRVSFTFYGEPHTGRVIRDNGRGLVWLEDDGGMMFRERWMHRESLTVLPR